MTNTLTLYTGPNCHLCEQARDLINPVLQQAGWQLKEVDIATSASLQARYGIRVPVMAVAGGEEKGWPFTAGQVNRLIAFAQLNSG